MDIESGKKMYEIVKDLFPLHRSLTGEGNRKTLSYLKRNIKELKLKSFKTGQKVFDWIIPDEWEIEEAWIKYEDGEIICDITESNLHIVGYSTSVNKWMNKEELEKNLHSLPEQPNAIPYITSYYQRRWGFCISNKKRLELKEGSYHVYIKSRHFKGKMNYGEAVLKGKTQKEILFSTYICHPSMANNELSGPALAVELYRYVSTKKHNYTYRFLFLPETIGTIAYLSKNFKKMKRKIVAGYVLTCVGDNEHYSFLPSKYGNTIADIAADKVLTERNIDHTRYCWTTRGSDERQYCSPGIDLPIASVMRSKYGTYDQYHTSEDNLEFVSVLGFAGSYAIYKDIIDVLDKNVTPIAIHKCEPQLGKRGLYPQISTKNPDDYNRIITDLLTYADGSNDMIEISRITGHTIDSLSEACQQLVDHKLIRIIY